MEPAAEGEGEGRADTGGTEASTVVGFRHAFAYGDAVTQAAALARAFGPEGEGGHGLTFVGP